MEGFIIIALTPTSVKSALVGSAKTHWCIRQKGGRIIMARTSSVFTVAKLLSLGFIKNQNEPAMRFRLPDDIFDSS